LIVDGIWVYRKGAKITKGRGGRIEAGLMNEWGFTAEAQRSLRDAKEESRVLGF
jgi:hypothetical protein